MISRERHVDIIKRWARKHCMTLAWIQNLNVEKSVWKTLANPIIPIKDLFLNFKGVGLGMSYYKVHKR